jgi:hypothetical protein
MDILPFNVIINEILKLTFPCTSVLFLTCKYFNNFQTKYYEYLGCSDKGSKNFMHMISNMDNNIKLDKIKCDTFSLIYYKFDILPFASESITILMNKYLDLYADIMSPRYLFTYGNGVYNTRQQIIMLIAYNTMKSNSKYIDIDIINQLLSYTDTKSHKIFFKKNPRLDYMERQLNIEYNVILVNKFYSMIGIKRSYYISSIYCEYLGCDYCGEDINDMCDCDYSCWGRHNISIKNYDFYCNLKNYSGSGDYFYYPNWYNKIYSQH